MRRARSSANPAPKYGRVASPPPTSNGNTMTMGAGCVPKRPRHAWLIGSYQCHAARARAMTSRPPSTARRHGDGAATTRLRSPSARPSRACSVDATVRRSAAMVAALWYRSSGFFASARVTMHIETRGHVRVEGTGRRRVEVQHPKGAVGRVPCRERGFAGQHVVQQRAQGEEVGTLIDRIPRQLLRRQAADRLRRDGGGFRRQAVRGQRLAVLTHPCGEPEVEDFRMALRRDDDASRR